MFLGVCKHHPRGKSVKSLEKKKKKKKNGGESRDGLFKLAAVGRQMRGLF